MKKLSLISVAALMLASCSNEEVVPAGEGQEQQVTISLELPAEINSRAMAGSSSANGGLTNVNEGLTFNVALYPINSGEAADAPVFVGTTTVGAGESVASFTPTVVLGKTYQVVAYASFDDGINWKENGVNDVNVAQVINDEAEDAYFTNEELTAAASMKATLTRPYGKIRIIANDYTEALETQFNSEISSITVTYKEGQATTFSPKTGNFGEDKGSTTFTANNFATSYSDETGDAKTIVVDYVPATETGDIVNIQSVTVTFKNEEVYTKDLSTLDIPVKRNCLTTLSGDFFTSDANLDLEVDDNLNQGDYITSDIAYVLANGGTVILDKDIKVESSLTVTTANPVVIDLNGHTITGEGLSNVAVIYVNSENANVTIKGEGTVTTSSAYPVAVKGANAVVTIEGGNYTATNSSQAAYAQAGTIYIKGGYFKVDSKYGDNTYFDAKGNGRYVLNCLDASYDNGTANIIVTGGSFYKFDPSSNEAEKRDNKPTSNFVAEGYKSTEIGDVYYVTKEGVTPVATPEGLADAAAKGGDVLLVENLTLDASDVITVGEGVETNLDLNDKTIEIGTGRSDDQVDAIINRGTMKVTNGKIAAGDDINSRRCIYNYGEMEIDGVELTQTYDKKGAAINNEGTMTINEATVNAVYYAIWNSGKNAELTIDGGTYKTTNNLEVRDDTWSYCVSCQYGAKMTVNGGYFEGNHGVIAATSGAEVELNGGKFHCTAEYTGNSDWTLYASGATITYDAENCEITTDNPAGTAATEENGVIKTK